jgi:hypothetical protein
MITVTQGQSFFDVGIQHSGAPEAAFDLAMLNGLSITDTLETGQVLNPAEVEGKRVFNYYKNNDLRPATGFTGDEKPEGIEFWYVEYDFVTS